jgi:hypothetical protein
MSTERLSQMAIKFSGLKYAGFRLKKKILK